jgi:hypothetical protein
VFRDQLECSPEILLLSFLGRPHKLESYTGHDTAVRKELNRSLLSKALNEFVVVSPGFHLVEKCKHFG